MSGERVRRRTQAQRLRESAAADAEPKNNGTGQPAVTVRRTPAPARPAPVRVTWETDDEPQEPDDNLGRPALFSRGPLSAASYRQHMKAETDRRLVRIAAALIALILLIGGAVIGLRHYRSVMQAREAEKQRQRLEAEKAQYPLHYRGMIEAYSEAQHLNPAFVAAIICCESRFDPQARSYLDARGLMQIMPETGEWIAGKLGEEGEFDPERLYDPQTSICYGTWYLKFLVNLFGTDPTVIAAAYHAGQGIVEQWLQDPRYSPDGKTLSEIPYEDTATYVGRVLSAYEMYLKHYYAQEPQAD